MVQDTLNLGGYALPAVPDPKARVPWRLRLAYAWKSLRGMVHIIGPIDVSHVKSEHYMEGRLRVDLTAREAEQYHIDSMPVRASD